MTEGAGFISRVAWQRLEAPLLAVDPVFERFAAEHGLHVRRNHKDWPERSLLWGDEVRCLIQLYLASVDALTFNLWLCAAQDRHGKRYWKQETPVEARPMTEIRGRLPALLEEGWKRLILWSENPVLLEFATELR